MADGSWRSVPVKIRPLGSYAISGWLLRQTGAVRHLRHFGPHLKNTNVTGKILQYLWDYTVLILQLLLVALAVEVSKVMVVVLVSHSRRTFRSSCSGTAVVMVLVPIGTGVAAVTLEAVQAVVVVQCCLVSPLTPPPLLSYWPVPDASAGPRSSETVLIRSACIAGRWHAASPPPIAGAASCLCPIGRAAAAAGHTHPPPPPGSEETGSHMIRSLSAWGVCLTAIF